jgi:hypothetical protein
LRVKKIKTGRSSFAISSERSLHYVLVFKENFLLFRLLKENQIVRRENCSDPSGLLAMTVTTPRGILLVGVSILICSVNARVLDGKFGML